MAGRVMAGSARSTAVVGVLLAASLLVASCGGSSSGGAKQDPSNPPGPKVAGAITASAFVSGDKEGLAKLKASGVWCRWVGDHVEMRVAFRNKLGAHITVHVQPNYRLANAGLHGDGLTSQEDVGIDAGKFRAWFGNLGSPDGIDGHPAITTCAPEINGVDLG